MELSFKSAADTKSAALHLLRTVLLASVTLAMLSASRPARVAQAVEVTTALPFRSCWNLPTT